MVEMGFDFLSFITRLSLTSIQYRPSTLLKQKKKKEHRQWLGLKKTKENETRKTHVVPAPPGSGKYLDSRKIKVAKVTGW